VFYYFSDSFIYIRVDSRVLVTRQAVVTLVIVQFMLATVVRTVVILAAVCTPLATGYV